MEFSLWIFEGSKFWKFLFSNKIACLNKHCFETWAWSKWNFFCVTEMYCVQDKIIIFNDFAYFGNISFLNDSKMLFFFKKIAHLSRHSFEKWAWLNSNFTYFYWGVWCGTQKMVSVDLFTFIANIWGLKDLKMFVF